MKLCHLRARLRKATRGSFRVLREGEPLEECDIAVYLTGLCDVSESNIGKPVERGEVILRLELSDD